MNVITCQLSDNSPCAGSSLASLSLEAGLLTPRDIGEGSVTSSRDPEADITPATDITPSLVSANTGYIAAESTRHVGLQVTLEFDYKRLSSGGISLE